MGKGGKTPGQILSELGFNGVWGGLGTRVIMIGTLTGGFEREGVGLVFGRTQSTSPTLLLQSSTTVLDNTVPFSVCSSAAVNID